MGGVAFQMRRVALSLKSFSTRPLITPLRRAVPRLSLAVTSLRYKHSETAKLSDKDILEGLESGRYRPAHLETLTSMDYSRAVKLRRQFVENTQNKTREDKITLKDLPWENYDYSKVYGACCENVIGFVPLPVGVVGPVLINGEKTLIPMATAEGALVASTHRGCKAINEAGGSRVHLLGDGMTRGPVVRMPDASRAAKLKHWLDSTDNLFQVAAEFNSTSRFARLQTLKCNISGRLVFIRFKSTTGDAMGMNMISKGVEKALSFIQLHFPDLELLSVSGNFCTDKKPSAINWLEGRGKSIVVEATIPAAVVSKTLKTEVDVLVEVNTAKNLVGSAMAGSIGGFNAHASNVVTAIFLATGQDPAQNVESSNCLTWMEKKENGDLYVSCTMPSVEVGTIGGGTHLPAQSACLDIMGVKGTTPAGGKPGSNAIRLAKAVGTAVLAGELSLMSALAAGHLVQSHMKHNRKSATPTKDEPEEILKQHTLPSDNLK